MRLISMATVCLIVLTAGCGNSADREPEVQDTPASGPSARLPAWTVKVTGRSSSTDLPDLQGAGLMGLKLGTNYQINGVRPDGLLASIATNGAVEARDYTPTMFKVTWTDLGYLCVAEVIDFTVTISSVDPLAGTFGGSARCQPGKDASGAFEARLEGSFRAGA